MLTQLENAAKVVGIKQVRRAMSTGLARELFLAKDADPELTSPLAEQAESQNIPVEWVDSMKKLGQACHIPVGASVAAIVSS